MSQHEPLPTYRVKEAGTVHTETSNPALLALLRENSAAASGRKDSNKPPEVAAAVTPARFQDRSSPEPEHPEEQGREVERPVQAVSYPVTGEDDSTLPYNTQFTTDSGQSSGRPAGAARRPVSQSSLLSQGNGTLKDRSEGQFSGHSFTGEYVSESDSHSSELAGLAPTPSRKSFAVDAPVERGRGESDDEADDEGAGDTEDGGDELDERNHFTGSAIGHSAGRGHTHEHQSFDRADERGGQRRPRLRTPTQQPPSAPGFNAAAAPADSGIVPDAASAKPLAQRLDPSAGSRSRLPLTAAVSSRLVDPDPDRFVAPYADRRLKDSNPAVRGPAVSISVVDERGQQTLPVPREEKWSVKQATRLRAREGSQNNVRPETGAVAGDLPPVSKDTGDYDSNELTDSLESSSTDKRQPAPNPSSGVSPYRNRNSSANLSSSDQQKPGLHRELQASPSHGDLNPGVRPNVGINSLTVAGEADTAPSQGGTPISILKRGHRKVEPEVDRVYVETPSFTKDEEDEYRFVSSRLDNHEDDEDHEVFETFRALDQQAVTAMEGSGVRAAKRPFKQVRYQDEEERFEDRESELSYARGRGHDPRGDEDLDPPPQPPAKERQYVLRSKSGSAQSSVEPGRYPQEVRELPVPPPPVQQPPRAKSLVLPSGPSYDPQDEEDLKRETYYQQELKDRVTTIQRQAEDTVIPRLSLDGRESGEGHYVHDSLDIPEDFELDSERVTKGAHPRPRRDSLEVYEEHRLHEAMQNTQWDDPPVPPPSSLPAAASGGGPYHRGRQGYLTTDQPQNYGRQQQGFGGPDYDGEPGPGYADRGARLRYEGSPTRGQQQGYGNPREGDFGAGETDEGFDRQEYDGPRRGYSNQGPGYTGNPRSQANPAGLAGMHQSEDFNDRGYGHGGGQLGPHFANQRLAAAQQERDGLYQPPDLDTPGQRRGLGQPAHYMDRGAPTSYANGEPGAGFYLTEPRGFNPARGGRGGGPLYSQEYDDDDGGNPLYYRNPAQGIDPDRYQSEDQPQTLPRKPLPQAPLMAPPPPLPPPPPPPILPLKPTYDYVELNKHDYGRPKRKNYKKIHEVKKEEEEKLTHIFIQPQVKGKKGQRSSRDSSPSHNPSIAEDPRGPEDETLGVENLWAQRSASLAIAKNAKLQGKRKPGSNASSLGTGPQYHSDSSLPNSGLGKQPLQPIQPASSMQLVPMQVGQLSPTNAGFRGIDLQPISQQLITEDGQRISVDVNLRLISPTMGPLQGREIPEVGAGYARQQAMVLQRPVGMQYPVANSRDEQQYGMDENDIPRGRYSADDLYHPKGGGPANRLTAGYMSDSNHDYGDPIFNTNPYKKIPPIASNPDAPRSAPVAGEGGSYMLSYLKEKEKMKSHQGGKPWYKVYGLADYKRMQNEIKLGTRTLGPDLDNETLRERREKAQRQAGYAKAVQDRNTKELMNRKPPSFPRTKEQQDDILSKRRLAVEYAKNVPKPTVRLKPTPFNNYELASKLSPIAKSARGPLKAEPMSDPSEETTDLQKLHLRHEQDKLSAEIIRQKAQGMVS